MSGAKRSSVRANSSNVKRWRLASSQVTVARIPEADAPDGVGLVLDGLALGAAKVPLGLDQDLAEELVLRGEVPVEDALAHAEAVDDVGDRRRVIADRAANSPAAKSSSSCRRRCPAAVRRCAMGCDATGGPRRVNTSGCPSTSGVHRALPCGVAYWVVKVLLSPVIRLLWRVRVEGREHVPRMAPVILAPNHVAFLDSVFLPLVIRRGASPSWPRRSTSTRGRRRGSSRPWARSRCAATGAARPSAPWPRRARSSKVASVGIYPEGTRSPDGRLYRGHTGVARLALGCKVPIVPVGLSGTDEVQRPGFEPPTSVPRVTVRFGPTAWTWRASPTSPPPTPWPCGR